MQVKGTIQFVVYPKTPQGDSIQFHVFSIRLTENTPGLPRNIKAVGHALPYPAGTYVELDGLPASDGDFKFTSCVRCDNDELGAKSMLEFCFGARSARNIIENAYEDRAMDAWMEFKHHPDRFMEKATRLRGIKTRKVQNALEKYESHAALDALMIAYSPYGLQGDLLNHVYARLGSRALSAIEANPYCLCRYGVPFKVADRIARNKYGYSEYDPKRIQACCTSSIHLLMNTKGHDFVWLDHPQAPGDSLIPLVTKTLNLDAARIRTVVADLVVQGVFILKTMPDSPTPALYLPVMAQAEETIASNFYRLSQPCETTPFTEDQVEEQIQAYEAAHGFQLADLQHQAVLESMRHPLSLISGPPGSGKTTIIDCICTLFQFFGLSNIQLAAPTGKAAKRMTESTGLPASTIHRLLGYYDEEFHVNAEEPLCADALIVDECSMCGTRLFAALLEAIPPHCRVIFVGDHDQLPSVDAGQVLDDMMQIDFIPKTVLNKVYRQGSDSTILQRALDLSAGRQPDFNPAGDFAFYQYEATETASLVRDVLGLYHSEINEWGQDNVMLLTPMNKGGLGTVELNALIQNEINPRQGDAYLKVGKREFRLGDRVMQTKNQGVDLSNGLVGRVIAIQHEDKETHTEEGLTVDYGDFTQDYTRSGLSTQDGQTVAPLADLTHAFAMTIHKCQGSEAQSVILLCDSSQQFMIRKKLIYTGMTRAKKRLQIFGQKSMLLQAVLKDEPSRLSRIVLESAALCPTSH